MAIYLESLACMMHFPFNHMDELELSYNCAKRHVSDSGQICFCSDLKFTAIHSLKCEEGLSVNFSSLLSCNLIRSSTDMFL